VKILDVILDPRLTFTENASTTLTACSCSLYAIIIIIMGLKSPFWRPKTLSGTSPCPRPPSMRTVKQYGLGNEMMRE